MYIEIKYTYYHILKSHRKKIDIFKLVNNKKTNFIPFFYNLTKKWNKGKFFFKPLN